MHAYVCICRYASVCVCMFVQSYICGGGDADERMRSYVQMSKFASIYTFTQNYRIYTPTYKTLYFDISTLPIPQQQPNRFLITTCSISCPPHCHFPDRHAVFSNKLLPIYQRQNRIPLDLLQPIVVHLTLTTISSCYSNLK